MTHWRKSLFSATVVLGVCGSWSTGLLAGPVATAQPADAQAAIDAHYQDKGGASSPLGQPAGEVYAFGPDGAARNYQGGEIVYSPETGAHVMYGAILDKYLALGGPDAGLGYPTNDESDAAVAGTARFSEFSAPDGATIEWSPQHGAWLVRGPIRAAWSKLDATDGPMGAPMSDTAVADGVYSQTFRGQNGDPVQISWSRDGGFVTVPPDLAGRIGDIDVSAASEPPGSAAAGSGDGTESASKWWALPLGLAIAAVAGMIAAMVTRTGRRERNSRPDAVTPASAVAPSAPDSRRAMPSAPDSRLVAAGGPAHRAGAHLATPDERAHPLTLGGASGQRF
ncbi:hypothetical protein LTV02_16625 [Nocardia yamanashiensis]|uniref:LGFP repeat-containing protein n=1 Tax=Nocardia yamanashiensis TaxID=209247 RepID=UPI001E559A7C|nr:hypothetical protein [Nocardia yamanashiensis]UGT44921.1 hypothetical protein LTV02_16625 [Nocardia yamanashiensis]